MPQPLRIALLVFAGLGMLGLIAFTFVRAFKRSDDPVHLGVRWIVTLVIVGALFWFAKDNVNTQAGAFMIPIACVVVAVILTPLWAPSIGRTLASPLTSMFDGGGEELDPAPLYSTAEALRKRGKCRESVYAIQEQLRDFPHDFTGQSAIVTGAARGIGHAIAKRLLAGGAKVALWDRDADALADAGSELASPGFAADEPGTAAFVFSINGCAKFSSGTLMGSSIASIALRCSSNQGGRRSSWPIS